MVGTALVRALLWTIRRFSGDTENLKREIYCVSIVTKLICNIEALQFRSKTKQHINGEILQINNLMPV
jgi:hypothetical protein